METWETSWIGICLVCCSRFLFIIHIDLYLFYPSLLGYPSHSPYCFPLDAYAYTCRYKHLYTTYLGIKSTLKEVKDNR